MAKKISEQDIKNLQRYQAEEAIGAKMREGHARSLDEITDATMKLAVYEARATAGLDKRTKVYKQINKDVEKLKGMLADEEKLREKINKHLGSTDNLLRGIKKIPFIGQFIDAEKIIKKMEIGIAKAKKGMEQTAKIKAFKEGMKAEWVKKKDTIMMAAGAQQASSAFGFLKEAIMEGSKLQSQFQKELGVSAATSDILRHNMMSIADSVGRGMNFKNVQDAMMSLNDQFGTASTIIRNDIVAETAKLMKWTNMSAESAARFAMFSNISGKNATQLTREARRGVIAAEKEGGARLNINKILDEAGKITGQISAQLGANPAKISKAVGLAKQFGMELREVAAAGNQLLNFESSIEKELEAELLLGRQLNLEKARLAALTGDYETLTREINENVGDFSDFTQLNVLQQNALAAALGMQSDQLADQLLKKANLKQLAQEARDRGDEDLAKDLEKRDLAMQFNDVMDKFKMILIEVADPLMDLVTGIANMVESAGKLKFLLSLVVAMKFGAMIMGLRSALMTMVGLSAATASWASGLTLGIAAAAIIASIWAIGSASEQSAKKQTNAYRDTTRVADAQVENEGGVKIKALKQDSVFVDKTGNIGIGTSLFGNDLSDASINKIGEALAIAVSKRPIHTRTEVIPDGFAARNPSGQESNHNDDTRSFSSYGLQEPTTI